MRSVYQIFCKSTIMDHKFFFWPDGESLEELHRLGWIPRRDAGIPAVGSFWPAIPAPTGIHGSQP